MKQYFGLLNRVATTYDIQKGNEETEFAWKGRLLYSLLGQIGYSSLFDTQDDLNPSSIVHFKNRITNSVRHLLMMYPEMNSLFSIEESSLADELYDLFLQTGCIYHEPNRIRPSVKRNAHGLNCTFMRGQAIDETKRISGVGCFDIIKDTINEPIIPGTVEEMFSLQTHDLKQQWNWIVSKAHFTDFTSDISLEYLRVVPPFKSGYWGNVVDSSGKISLARTSLAGKRIYYLYRMEGKRMKISQLPEWMTDGHNYRSVSTACLADRESLPATEYYLDGPIVTLRIGYLFPPSEMNFINLYSWPKQYYEFPHNFTRIMNTNVFNDIKVLFERIGYQFKEVCYGQPSELFKTE